MECEELTQGLLTVIREYLEKSRNEKVEDHLTAMTACVSAMIASISVNARPNQKPSTHLKHVRPVIRSMEKLIEFYIRQFQEDKLKQH